MMARSAADRGPHRAARVRAGHRQVPPRYAADRPPHPVQGLGVGQALLLPLGAVPRSWACRPRPRRGPCSRRRAAQSAPTSEDHRRPDAQPQPPARPATEDGTIVEEVPDRRVEHRARRSQHRHDPQPTVTRQRSHTGERDQREDDHQPTVMRAFDTVERHRCCAAPGSEDTDDGEEDGCMADPAQAGGQARHDLQAGRQRGVTQGDPIAAHDRHEWPVMTALAPCPTAMPSLATLSACGSRWFGRRGERVYICLEVGEPSDDWGA